MGEIHKKALEEEKNLVEILNSMSQEKLVELFNLKDLDLHGKYIYAVHVKTKQESAIHKGKVHPKADAFLILAEKVINKKYLSDIEILCSLRYKPIPKTGISVKREGSKNYTLVKISPSSFKNFFKNTELAAAASLYEKPNDKNLAVLEGWGTNPEEFEKFLMSEGIISPQENFSMEDENMLKKIKQKAIERIKNKILTDQNLKDKLLWGIGLFTEPYSAHYFYQDCKLSHKDDTEIDFSVTTGSGRSRGDFTIVLKPKNVVLYKFKKIC